MTDALMLTMIVAFFVLCIAYVSWCDRIIGPDSFEPGPLEPGPFEMVDDNRASYEAGALVDDEVPGDVAARIREDVQPVVPEDALA